MPSGKYYSLEFRMLVFKNHVQYGHSPEWILRHCFAVDAEHNWQTISLKYLTTLCSRLNASPEFAEDYLLGAKTYLKTGRPPKVTTLQSSIIMDMLRDHRRIKLTCLRRLYYRHYHGVENQENVDLQISRQSVSKVIKNASWTIKTSEYRNINYNVYLANDYLLRVAHVDPMLFIDIDESGTEADSFGAGAGYAPIGEKYMRTQFVVRGNHYSIIAAATPLGFLHHRIFIGGVNDQAFIEFLDSLAPLITPDQVGLLDNAAILNQLKSVLS